MVAVIEGFNDQSTTKPPVERAPGVSYANEHFKRREDEEAFNRLMQHRSTDTPIHLASPEEWDALGLPSQGVVAGFDKNTNAIVLNPELWEGDLSKLSGMMNQQTELGFFPPGHDPLAAILHEEAHTLYKTNTLGLLRDSKHLNAVAKYMEAVGGSEGASVQIGRYGSGQFGFGELVAEAYALYVRGVGPVTPELKAMARTLKFPARLALEILR